MKAATSAALNPPMLGTGTCLHSRPRDRLQALSRFPGPPVPRDRGGSVRASWMSYPHGEVVQPTKALQGRPSWTMYRRNTPLATALRSETICAVNPGATTHAVWPQLADAELLTGEHRADARSKRDKSGQ